jgi:hypothetical protein
MRKVKLLDEMISHFWTREPLFGSTLLRLNYTTPQPPQYRPDRVAIPQLADRTEQASVTVTVAL